MGIRIQHVDGGPMFEADEGTPIPDGFRPVGGTIERTATPDSLAGNIWDSLRNLGYSDYARTATNGVYNALDLTTPLAEDPAHAQRNFRAVAEAVVPQTPGAFGRTAGMIAAGGVPGWGAAMAYPAIGGLIGGMLGGDDATGLMREGVQGAVEGGVGKAVGAGLGALRRAGGLSWLGMPGQQAIDEQAVGRAMSQVSPTLGGLETAKDFQNVLVGNKGKDMLRGRYMDARNTVESQLRGKPGFETAQPAVAPETFSPLTHAPGEGPPQAGFPAPLARTEGGFPGGALSSNPITAREGGALAELTGKQAMTFDEAASAIELLRDGRHPLTGALSGSQKAATERALKAKAVGELAQALDLQDPALAKMFLDAEASYGRGLELIRLFRQAGVLDPQTGGLNMPALQALAGTKQGTLERMLGPDGWTALREAIWRGSSPPGMDLPGIKVPLLERLRAGSGMGPMSMGTSTPLTFPGTYVGNAVSVPSLPFMLGGEAAANVITSPRNPFRRNQ